MPRNTSLHDRCWVRWIVTAVMILGLASFLVPQPAGADFGAWSTNGPASNITALAVDQTNDQTVYAGGAGGLWKTTNAGGSWTAVNATTPLGKALVLDPFAAGTLYAISGDAHNVLKCSGSCTSWATIYTPGTGYTITDLVADPNNANVLYAALAGSSAQVARSLDGGASWTLIAAPNIGMGGIGGAQATSLAMLPGVSNLLYAGIQVYHGGFVMKTANASTVPTPTFTTIVDSSQAQALSSPWKVVVAGNASDRATYSSWTVVGIGELTRNDNDGAPVKLGANLPYRSASSSSYISTMTVNPGQPNWLYAAIASEPAGQLGVFASPDRGASWTEMGKLNKGVNDLKLAVRSHTLYAATATGVYQMMIAWPVNTRFSSFYTSHDGLRLLGAAISAEYVVNSYHSQYFEKARIEDHQGESSDPNWRFMYGLLVDELQQAHVTLPVGGDSSTMTYNTINTLADPSKRVAPPAGYPGNGSWTYVADGTTFIPFTTDLHGANGHLVLGGFWNYINRQDLFPGGWLHDVGLPIMEAQEVTVTKNFPTGPVTRKILVQAFQRTILTYDPANPPEWQIERANVGTDYRIAFPTRVGP